LQNKQALSPTELLLVCPKDMIKSTSRKLFLYV
jgi:hypothetical protein